MKSRADVVMAPVFVAAVVLGALLSTGDFRVSLLGIGALLAVVLSATLRLSMVDLVVILSPFMFYPPIGMAVNISAADFAIPILAIQIIALRRPIPTPLAWYTLLLTGALVASLSLSVMLRGGDFVMGLVATGKIFICLVVMSLFAAAAMDKDIGRLVRVWVRTSLVIAVLSMLSSFGYLQIPGVTGSGRTSGSFEDPNLYGAYLVISLGLATSSLNSTSNRIRVAQIAVLTVAAVSTGSRGTMLALGGMLICAILLVPSLGFRIRLVGGLVVGGAVAGIISLNRIAWLPGSERLVKSTEVAEGDIRFQLWTNAIEAFLAHPLIGIGPGQALGPSALVVHSTFLSFLAETGIIGTLLFLWLFFWLSRRLWTLRREGGLGFVLAGVGLVIAMASLNLQNVRLVWALVALVYVFVAQKGVESSLWPGGERKQPRLGASGTWR